MQKKRNYLQSKSKKGGIFTTNFFRALEKRTGTIIRCLRRFLPHEKANRTRMKSVMNLRISITIRLSDTCNGPKYGLTEKMQTSFKLEKILAAAKRPSEISMGSQVSQCSRFKWAAGLPVRSSSCTLKIMGSRNVNQLQKFNFLKLLWCP